MPTLKFVIEFDAAEAVDRDAAHEAIDAWFDSISTAGSTEPTNASDTSQGAGLIELSGDSLRQFLRGLAVGSGAAPLNGGERAMLRAIAERAPEPLPYHENRELLGFGAKFGNVSSSLARRFESRGRKLPYADSSDLVGYAMSVDDAAIVIEVLDQTE